jgi:hypothetical protein
MRTALGSIPSTMKDKKAWVFISNNLSTIFDALIITNTPQ